MSVDAGAGDDRVTLAGAALRGSANLQLGGGGDEAVLTDVAAGGNVGVNARRGAGGSDTVLMDEVFAGNVVAILTGGDGDDVDLTEVSARRFDVRLGDGDDALDVTELAVRARGRGANLQLGAGDDEATLTDVTAADSAVGVNAAAGADSIVAEAVTGFPYVFNTGSSIDRGAGTFDGRRTFAG